MGDACCEPNDPWGLSRDPSCNLLPPKNAYRGALYQLIFQKSSSWGLLKAQTEVFSTPHIKGGEHHIRTIMVFQSPSRTCRVARLKANVTLPMETSSPPLPSENVIGIIL